MGAWRVYWWAGFPDTENPRMPKLAGPPDVFMYSTCWYAELTDEEDAWKQVEAAVGQYPQKNLYNFDGWRYLVISGKSFRITHPRPDGQLWMLGVLYSAEGFPTMTRPPHL